MIEINPGVIRPFAIDFSDDCSWRVNIASIVAATVVVSPESDLEDPNAAALAIGEPALVGAVVTRTLGGAWEPGARYIFDVTVQANTGWRFRRHIDILCKAVV